MKTLTVNKNAKKESIQKAIQECIEQATAAAERGQDRVTLRYNVPDYIAASEVMDAMNKEGVYCVVRGFGRSTAFNGSTNAEVKCTIGYNTI